MTEPILQVRDLSVYYEKKKALNNVSLDIFPNEITTLIGPSRIWKINPSKSNQPYGRFESRMVAYRFYQL